MKCPESIEESPDTVHGRLLESVHISGYSFERASQEFEWLLEENRWKKIGTGYDDIDKFIATIDFSEFKISIEKRKKISKKLADLRATQRAAAKMLGVDPMTVNRDLQPVENATKQKLEPVQTAVKNDAVVENATKLPTEHSGAEVAEMAAKLAEKEIKKEARQEQIEKERETIKQSAETVKINDRWNVEQADLNTWKAPRQYDFIITDPPYKKEFLPLYDVLAQRAAEWLKPDGLLIAMCGQSYLNQIYFMLDKHLTYYWTGCYLTPGQPTPLRQVNVNTTWKPLLIYKRNKYSGKIFGDVFKSDGNDKSLHEWGQSISGMSDIVNKICLPGQYILDPFAGAGTTGIAAVRNGCFFDGIDIDSENIKICLGRLNDETKE